MRIRQALCIMAIAIVPTTSFAGVLGDLTGMFMSNSTASGTITSKDRAGVFGGSFSMRTPIQAINVVAFDPPRLEAGCGGIDLYGGSFTFINSQQLVALLRQVASNAVGLAFKAAIDAINPSLGKLITEFQTLLQQMNNLAKNSCSLAHLVVDPFESKIHDAVNGTGSVGGTSMGWFSDTSAALTSYLQDANAYMRRNAAINPKAGNGNVKALLASGTSGVMGMAGIANVDGSADDATDPNSLNNRIIISFLGYEISGVPCGKSNEAGVANTTAPTGKVDASTPDISKLTCAGGPTLTLDDLIKGGGIGSTRPTKPLTLYRCVNPAGAGAGGIGFDPQVCTQMQKADFNYSGIQGWVNVNLFGNPDGVSATPTSIVGRFNSGSSVTFTPGSAQALFIQQSGVPLLALMTRTQNPAYRVAIAQRLSGFIADCVAARLGEAIYKASSGLEDANDGYKLSADAKKNIEILRQDYLAKQNACLADRRVLDLITEINEGTRLRAATRN